MQVMINSNNQAFPISLSNVSMLVVVLSCFLFNVCIVNLMSVLTLKQKPFEEEVVLING
jgi:hypothetical protein